MAEQHNEVHGRDITGALVQAGRIDHLEVNLGDVPAEAGHPPLTSWQDRPPLTPMLTDLLMAQRDATESLPYTLLGVRDPGLLNDIYVQQSLRPETHADRALERERRTPAKQETPEQAEFGERPVSVTEALNRGRHLVITGEAGAGKSTLGFMYVQRLSVYWLGSREAQPPLTEPVLPLRIPARALAGRHEWHELLVEGVREALGGMLGTRLRSDVLGQRALGARWLVFVDGLDEIAEPGIQRQVIKTIGYQMRRNPNHRLVVTTRPLEDRELESLYGDRADQFRIQPFGQVELEEFAWNWFQEQDAITARGRAADFLQQVRDSRLRDLVRNPLQATIAAITVTLRPDRSLPNNLADLYERFMNHLLTDTASGRRTIADVRRSLLDQPIRLQVFDWVARHRDAVVTHLAVQRLDSESSLSEAAADWVAKGQDVVGSSELPDGWRDDLRVMLVSSGVFGQAEGDLRFRHHSFAEFLAARDRAPSIPPDFPELDAWIDRGLNTATRRFALFVFVLWSRREGHDIALVLHRLLSGRAAEVLLAARLIAEGVEVAKDLAARVVDRLVDLIVCGGTSQMHRTSAGVTEVVASLDHHTVGAPTTERLQQLRDQPEVAVTTRIECAAALGHLTGSEEALRWLEEFATEIDSVIVGHIVQVMTDLAPDGVDRAERLLVRLGSTADADYVVVLAVVALLVRINRERSAAPLVRNLIRRLRQDPGITPDMPVMPNRPTTTGPPLRVRDAWEETTPTWGDVADLAVKAGCPDEALWAARRSLARPHATEHELGHAVKAMMTAAGADVLGEVVDEVVAAARSRPLAQVLGIAVALENADSLDAAGELAHKVLADRQATDGQIGAAARVFLSAPRGSADEALSLVRERGELLTWRWLELADALKETGALAEARRIIQQLLDDPATRPSEFWQAAKLLLDSNEDTAAEDVFRTARAHSPERCAQAAPLLADVGREDLARELLPKVFEPPAALDVLTEMANSFRRDGKRELLAATVEVALPLADQADPSDIPALVEALTAAGRAGEATALARSAFVRMATTDENPRWTMEAWLQAGGERSAADIVAQVLAADIRAEWRVQIAEEFADAGLLEAAITVWLDVVRWHGSAVDQGIAAAARLVACGYRDRVIETATEELTDERLLPVARAQLQALLAWVVYSHPEATAAELQALLSR